MNATNQQKLDQQKLAQKLKQQKLRAEDAALVRAAQEDDAQAFRTLVERNQRRAHHVALSILKDADDAHDATQEAFVRAHRNLKRFNGECTFWTWLYRIVVNVCIDARRKRKRMPTVSFEDAWAVGSEATILPFCSDMRLAHPGHALEQQELGQMLKEAFNGLSEAHRDILMMREVDCMSYAEIAERLGCAPGTVMSRLHHARHNFRKAFGPYMKRGGRPKKIITRLAA
ncbi:MAG: RNA polymerase sigma factor [Bradymonadia bacterium]